MFRLDDVWDEGLAIQGSCDEQLFLRWAGDVVSMIANKAEFEGFRGWLDICTTDCGQCITLPREVETVLGVNMGGRPSLGLGVFFNFHLNGPGDCNKSCDWSWQDQGQWHSTYRDLITPGKLVVNLSTPADNGKQFIVYGFDSNGQVLRRKVGADWLNGYQVPTTYGYAVPDATAPTISRITGIFKERSAGSMQLSTIDASTLTGTLLGVYEPDETIPQYRRIRLNRPAQWVRVAYMKANPVFHSRYDHVPLRSRMAFLLGMQARKHYKDLQLADARSFEADAFRLEMEAQQKAEPAVLDPVQVVDRTGSLRDKTDYQIL